MNEMKSDKKIHNLIKEKMESYPILYFFLYTVYFYVAMIAIMYFSQIFIKNETINDRWQNVCLGGMTIYPMIVPAFIFRPLYNFLEVVLGGLAYVICKWLQKIASINFEKPSPDEEKFFLQQPKEKKTTRKETTSIEV
jgi:hypothetical protein